MYGMLVPAQSEDGKTYLVLKEYLTCLINERKIRKFRRSDDWCDVDKDQRNNRTDAYHGPERRLCNIINSTLFSHPVEEQLRKGHSVQSILGFGQKAQEIAVKLASVAKTNLSVLIQGKTGTGKGIVALILRELSSRKDMPFIRVDCGTIPPTLIESELFGHEKGSFTGASKNTPGKFQLAKGGTLFLDEIANLSLDMQTRLLGFFWKRESSLQ